MNWTKECDVRMEPFPKQDEIWRTGAGRLVKINFTKNYMPGPLERIYADLADDGEKTASLGIFWLNGAAVMGKDHLVERVEQ